jgi:putative addiction module killer protein
MEVKKRNIEFLETNNGKTPFKQWHSKLKDLKGKAKIDIRVRRAGLGNFGDHKPIGSSIIELRISHGPGYRVYLAITSNDELILLLAGGDKSSQARDIEKAKEYFAKWSQDEK